MRLEKLLGSIMIAVGVTCLLLGVYSSARMMSVFLPNIEGATKEDLTYFFYASTPQVLLWSIAFATFFASGIFLVKTGPECTSPEDGPASQPSYEELLKEDHMGFSMQPRNEAEERIRFIKSEVLRAIKRLEDLDRQEEATGDPKHSG
ncbi:hypothetical protein KEJ39_02365 [Candidatus Bathyarchaeota archaeon]|nr:hypothetical protein [Candidatus Bathyarchaeota archaeon]